MTVADCSASAVSVLCTGSLCCGLSAGMKSAGMRSRFFFFSFSSFLLFSATSAGAGMSSVTNFAMSMRSLRSSFFFCSSFSCSAFASAACFSRSRRLNAASSLLSSMDVRIFFVVPAMLFQMSTGVTFVSSITNNTISKIITMNAPTLPNSADSPPPINMLSAPPPCLFAEPF